MGADVGVGGFCAPQQEAIISRPYTGGRYWRHEMPDAGLSGDEDNTIPNALSVEMVDDIHNAKLVILPNCGHLPQVEQPQATAEALAEWLRG